MVPLKLMLRNLIHNKDFFFVKIQTKHILQTFLLIGQNPMGAALLHGEIMDVLVEN